MSRTVAEALVDVLEEVGVKQVFGLIGETLNPSGDAVRRSKLDGLGGRRRRRALSTRRFDLTFDFSTRTGSRFRF
jgi:pyruvate dehydrogenase (quinone)